ncbi:MAG: peptide chain release factor 2 [Clostridia bacterium]
MTLSRSVFDENGLKKIVEECKTLQEKEDFWSNLENAGAINKKEKLAKSKLSEIDTLKKSFDNVECLIELFEETGDNDIQIEMEREVLSLEQKVEKLRLQTLLKGKYDANNAILTLHAGAGGTEAQDWTSMLYRMYQMYCENEGFKIKVLDILEGDSAGYKSITFLVEGDNAYGYLRAEKGVHRLVRISPFDAGARRHTSFASLEVIPEIDKGSEIEIRSEDLKVDTYRSSGAGGQHVNKTESAIRITHLPTGLVVSCQTERSQIQNRETAMRMLMSKLIEKKESEEMERLSEIRGEIKRIEWGSQIRSYVFQPYTLVKDHRTGFETGNIEAVMNGEIQEFINEYLKKS